MDWERLGRVVNGLLDRITGNGAPLGAEERVVYLAYFFDAEVHNGGFDQFFFNSQGNHTAETLDALGRIGAVKSAEFLRRACEAFGTEAPSPDRDVRWAQMERIHPEVREGWHSLDTLYYDSGESVPELLDRYLGGQA